MSCFSVHKVLLQWVAALHPRRGSARATTVCFLPVMGRCEVMLEPRGIQRCRVGVCLWEVEIASGLEQKVLPSAGFLQVETTWHLLFFLGLTRMGRPTLVAE